MDRNYEQEYKKAFEAAKGLHDAGNALTKKQMEIVFPQLAESEDERIRKALIEGVSQIRCKGDITREQMLAYLEKQKEQKEPHFTKRNALFDKCVENCDPKTVQEVNKRVDDIMNMPELSAFEQALTNFIGYWEDDEERWPSKFVKKHGKHILDMAREELQKEMKPVEYLPKEKAYDINSDGYIRFHGDIAEGEGRGMLTQYLPYLRPMSSMTEEEKEEYCDLQDKFLCSSQYPVTDAYELFDWLNEHHFDYRGLIEKGLALEAKEGMYKTK